jgi:hypothetical protein
MKWVTVSRDSCPSRVDHIRHALPGNVPIDHAAAASRTSIPRLGTLNKATKDNQVPGGLSSSLNGFAINRNTGMAG